MAAKAQDLAPIIKKIKKVHGYAHHGGAWKVAYADFVTAMMAFFLLLWLLNVTTDEQKRGIADYFAPSIASQSSSGSGGVLGGQTIMSTGALQDTTVSPSITVVLESPSSKTDQAEEPPPEAQTASAPVENAPGEMPSGESNAAPVDTELARKLLAKQEEERFRQAEFQLRKAVESVPDLAQLAPNLVMDRTPEGLRIQIVDQDKTSMFQRGSAEMLDHTKKLLALVAQVVARLPNHIAISGHTDATQYTTGADYTNWELSADRANASRRALIAAGVPAGRLDSVVGKADQELFVADNANDPRNRRISIVLLHEAGTVAPTP